MISSTQEDFLNRPRWTEKWPSWMTCHRLSSWTGRRARWTVQQGPCRLTSSSTSLSLGSPMQTSTETAHVKWLGKEASPTAWSCPWRVVAPDRWASGHSCRPRWSRGNVLALRSKVCGFKSSWGRWIFQELKILSTSPRRGTWSWGSRVWDLRLVKEP